MRVYIITSAKYEECYIEEWVQYHLNIGFDKIIINDNNPKDYPYKLQNILKKYIDSEQVVIERYFDKHEYNKYENIDNIIPNIYWWLYKKYENEFDWVAKLDIDEYLEITETNNNVKKFLEQDKFNNALSIVIPWNVYTVKEEYKKYYTRLTNNRDRYIKLEGQSHCMWSFKSIIRKTDLLYGIDLHFGNFYNSHYINYCLSDGNDASKKLLICCDNISDEEQFKCSEQHNDYIENNLINKSCCINHYGDCCIEEEVNRCIKFNCDTNDNWCRHEFYLELKEQYQEMFDNPRDLYKIYFLSKKYK